MAFVADRAFVRTLPQLPDPTNFFEKLFQESYTLIIYSVIKLLYFFT